MEKTLIAKNPASQARQTKPQAPANTASSREEFLAARTPGQLISGDDLYWILFRSASETNSADSFILSVESYLDAALGENNYNVAIDTTQNGGNGPVDVHGKKLTNVVLWAGTAGVLPGSVQQYAVTCFLLMS